MNHLSVYMCKYCEELWKNLFYSIFYSAYRYVEQYLLICIYNYQLLVIFMRKLILQKQLLANLNGTTFCLDTVTQRCDVSTNETYTMVHKCIDSNSLNLTCQKKYKIGYTATSYRTPLLTYFSVLVYDNFFKEIFAVHCEVFKIYIILKTVPTNSKLEWHL